jgi:hypothetical protein
MRRRRVKIQLLNKASTENLQLRDDRLQGRSKNGVDVQLQAYFGKPNLLPAQNE